MKKITIAVDGYSSCGKSTLAKALAQALNYTFIDSGAMYRATTLYFLENQVDLQDEEAVERALEHIHIQFRHNGIQNRTLLNGRDVEDEIRKMYVSDRVSDVAAISRVRKKMVGLQREMGSEKGIIMDGRDIGTVVFPDAELKLFITAHPDIRAQRRFMELRTKGLEVNLAEVKSNLYMRDHIDSTREDSPLKKASDAIIIDNSFLSPEQQLEKALQLVDERIRRLQIRQPE